MGPVDFRPVIDRPVLTSRISPVSRISLSRTWVCPKTTRLAPASRALASASSASAALLAYHASFEKRPVDTFGSEVEEEGGLAFAGIGLLVACRASTTEAVQGLMNLVMVPMYLFSGVFFSSERFPNAVQPFIQALPLTQLVSALRRVLLEGAGLIEVGPALVILAAWAVITFCLALRFFRWA